MTEAALAATALATEALTVMANPVTLGPQQVVRPERNLEKWPLWEPSNSRHRAKERTLQREIRLPDGSIAVAKVVVGFSNYGVLSTEDQKVCYALIKIWEERDKPEGHIYFSRQQLARLLRKSWGSRVNKSLTDSLYRLRFTPFVWERSYYDSTAKETVERIDTFNILSELHLMRRSPGSSIANTAITTESSFFQFNERILTNLLNGHTRPVFLDTILSFKSEIAQILYTHLDLVMADKTHYERRTRELFLDLGIDGTAYRYQSKRAQALEGALRELQGAPVPHGVLREVTLEPTVDKKDLKIVVRKEKARSSATGASRRKLDGEAGREAASRASRASRDGTPPSTASAMPPTPPSASFPSSQQGELHLFAPVVTAVVNEALPKKPRGATAATITAKEKSRPDAVVATPQSSLSAPKSASFEEGMEQARHFYQTFFQSGDAARPTDKEIALASQHVARLGRECARYMVLFAYREAKRTQFAIQNYGGIAQYEGRASAEFTTNEAQRQEAHQKKAREAHQRRFAPAHGDYLWDCLIQLENAPTEPMKRFLRQEKEEGDRLAAGKLAQTDVGKRALSLFASPSNRLDRFREFLKTQREQGRRLEGVLTFWEWDAERNPEGLKPI